MWRQTSRTSLATAERACPTQVVTQVGKSCSVRRKGAGLSLSGRSRFTRSLANTEHAQSWPLDTVAAREHGNRSDVAKSCPDCSTFRPRGRPEVRRVELGCTAERREERDC